MCLKGYKLLEYFEEVSRNEVYIVKWRKLGSVLEGYIELIMEVYIMVFGFIFKVIRFIEVIE